MKTVYLLLFLIAIVSGQVRISEQGTTLDIQAKWNDQPWLSRGRVNEMNWAQLLDDHNRMIASAIYEFSHSSSSILYLGLNTGAVQRNILHSKRSYRITSVEVDQELISFYQTHRDDAYEQDNHRVMAGSPYKLVSTMALKPLHYDVIVEDIFNGDQLVHSFQDMKKLTPSLVVRHFNADTVDISNLITSYESGLVDMDCVLLSKGHHSVLIAQSGISCARVMGLSHFQVLNVRCSE